MIVLRVPAALLAVLWLFAQPLGAQGLPPAQARAFDRGDRESQDLMTQVRCAYATAQARQEKRFASLDSAVDATECIRVGTHLVVAFIGGDTLFRHPSRFAGYDLTAKVRVTDRVDTAAVLAMARADWEAVRRGMPVFEAADRQFSPLAFRFDGDTIEIWLLPVSAFTGSPFSLGGEHGYIYSPDGGTLVREVDHFAEYRTITVPDTGVVTITSTQKGIPTLSEFFLANQLNARDRIVAINMPGLTSVLTGSGAQAVWTQLIHH